MVLLEKRPAGSEARTCNPYNADIQAFLYQLSYL